MCIGVFGTGMNGELETKLFRAPMIEKCFISLKTEAVIYADCEGDQ